MAYVFPAHTLFLDRQDELAELGRWWNDQDYRFPLILYKRRLTGKSWLVREFANGKDADIFVCDERAERDQLSSFADDLEERLGFRPDFPDFRSFCRFLFRQAPDQRRLAVIDEFPLLIGPGRSPADSALAAVMDEELDRSRLKLLLCGSQISTMQELLAARRPLHGRGRAMPLPPLSFRQARTFLGQHSGADLLVRYGIAGGMPLYLSRFERRAPVKRIVAEDLLNPLGPLFNEPRDVLVGTGQARSPASPSALQRGDRHRGSQRSSGDRDRGGGVRLASQCHVSHGAGRPARVQAASPRAGRSGCVGSRNRPVLARWLQRGTSD